MRLTGRARLWSPRGRHLTEDWAPIGIAAAAIVLSGSSFAVAWFQVATPALDIREQRRDDDGKYFPCKVELADSGQIPVKNVQLLIEWDLGRPQVVTRTLPETKIDLPGGKPIWALISLGYGGYRLWSN